MPIGYLYVFLGEMCIYIFAHFLFGLVFFVVELYELFLQNNLQVIRFIIY